MAQIAAILKFKMEALSYKILIAITQICCMGIISLPKNMMTLCPPTGNEKCVWLMHYMSSARRDASSRPTRHCDCVDAGFANGLATRRQLLHNIQYAAPLKLRQMPPKTLQAGR